MSVGGRATLTWHTAGRYVEASSGKAGVFTGSRGQEGLKGRHTRRNLVVGWEHKLAHPGEPQGGFLSIG